MHYVFKVEKPSLRVLYYTGDANSVWSAKLEDAESLTEFQAQTIADIAKAHYSESKLAPERKHYWFDDL